MWAPAIAIILLSTHCLVSCLDSNVIRSSKELDSSQEESSQQARPRSSQVDKVKPVHSAENARRRTEQTSNSNRRAKPCTGPDCEAPPRDSCSSSSSSNRAQRRKTDKSAEDRQRDRDRQREGDTVTPPAVDGNRTKGSEMSPCVRSGDCEAGLCCSSYLKVKRCMRIPVEGEACLLKQHDKKRKKQSKLGRCDCASGLSCQVSSREDQSTPNNPRLGVCMPSPSHGQRSPRHSGKKRMPERGC